MSNFIGFAIILATFVMIYVMGKNAVAKADKALRDSDMSPETRRLMKEAGYNV